jgi:hypothetical protein
MKQLRFSAIMLVFVTCSLANVFAKGNQREYYLLKTYLCNNASQIAMVDDYLSNLYLPALRKQGIDKVGVFKPLGQDTSAVQRVFIFIPVKTLKMVDKLEQAMEQPDPFAPKGNALEDAPADKPAFARVETILLKAFAGMPHWRAPVLSGSAAEKVYELRSYEGATEQLYRRKVHMFDKGGEIELFDKLGFNAVFYAQVLAGARMPNLMYMTSFNNMNDRNAHWDVFRNHPEWKAMSSLPQYKNTVSKSEVILMKATSYSEF